jgi:dynein heavy chain
VRQAEENEASINEARESYRSAATRASILYFVIADLAAVNPMYQFSLAYFGRMFKACLGASGRSEDVAVRLRLLGAYTTEFVYRNVARGLFEDHKGLFSFLLASAVARHPSAGEVSPEEWAVFLHGPSAAVALGSGGSGLGDGTAARPQWVPEGAWRGLAHLESAGPAALKGIASSMATGVDAEAWHAW